MRFSGLGDGNLPFTKDGQCGWCWDRETAVSAVDPTVAFDNPAGQDAGFTEQFQGNAAADDVDDGIDGAHFMEVHLLGRHTVDLSFGNGDPFEKLRTAFSLTQVDN
jgi:hypothetical protein